MGAANGRGATPRHPRSAIPSPTCPRGWPTSWSPRGVACHVPRSGAPEPLRSVHARPLRLRRDRLPLHRLRAPGRAARRGCPGERSPMPGGLLLGTRPSRAVRGSTQTGIRASVRFGDTASRLYRSRIRPAAAAPGPSSGRRPAAHAQALKPCGPPRLSPARSAACASGSASSVLGSPAWLQPTASASFEGKSRTRDWPLRRHWLPRNSQ